MTSSGEVEETERGDIEGQEEHSQEPSTASMCSLTSARMAHSLRGLTGMAAVQGSRWKAGACDRNQTIPRCLESTEPCCLRLAAPKRQSLAVAREGISDAGYLYSDSPPLGLSQLHNLGVLSSCQECTPFALDTSCFLLSFLIGSTVEFGPGCRGRWAM